MATWQYTAHLFPAEYVRSHEKIDMDFVDNFPGWHGIKLSTLSATLGATFGAEQVLYGARSFGKSDESCAYLLYDERADSVGEISFRFDLRRSIRSEVEAMLELARNLRALIVTQDFKIIRPENLENMKQAILASDAAKFAQDPASYFDSLG
jgi:hypothetical protein